MISLATKRCVLYGVLHLLVTPLFLREKMVAKSCCFIGHRQIEITDELVDRLNLLVENLIKKGVKRFIFGSRSEFDSLCHSIVTKLKIKYPEIIRVVYNTKSEAAVYETERSRFEKSYSRILNKCVSLAGYEEIHKPDVMYKSGRASYLIRNRIMIDESDYCIFYYDKTYTVREQGSVRLPKNRINNSSGTLSAYNYAKRKEKNIFNVADPTIQIRAEREL